MASAGLWMLASVAVMLALTGLPVFVVLLGVSVLFAGFGMLTGAIEAALLTALSSRLIGLLESDLLQALPLYVLMGTLLDRLPLADILFRAGNRLFARSPAAPLLSALGLGALIAPMNGSAGASAMTLARVVRPRLDEFARQGHSLPADRSLAVVCVASTLGVVVPPSLVLLLLGDAMMRAHTEAVNATGLAMRIVNTQDVFRGALPPAALFLVAAFALTWWAGRRGASVPALPLPWRSGLIAAATVTLVCGLLGAVAAGYFYAVEAASLGAFLLVAAGLLTRTLTAEVLADVLRRTMALSGALFALFIGATTPTLLFRAFGTDRLLAEMVAALPGGPSGAMAGVLAIIALSALVLDAFEIIFVIVPVIMPPLLMRVPDAPWVAVLTLLALQTSFLLPPLGYAVIVARTTMGEVGSRRLFAALAPYLLLQGLVLAVVAVEPRITHLMDAAEMVITPGGFDDSLDEPYQPPE